MPATFKFDRAAIMRTAHRYWKMQTSGGSKGWMGHRATFGDCVRRAWQAAKYEAWSVNNGRTCSSRGIEATLEMCEYLVVAAAPVIELRRAA
jgi:hypothetical protein